MSLVKENITRGGGEQVTSEDLDESLKVLFAVKKIEETRIEVRNEKYRRRG